MSLTTRHTSLLIGLSSRLGSATPALVNEVPNITNEGWDTLTQLWTIRSATLTPEAVAALFPIGAQLGSRAWWITGAKPEERAPGFWTVLVSYAGWAATKPALVRVGSAAASQSASNVTLPDTSVADKLETHQNTPTLTISYLKADVSSFPKTSYVGTALTPPVTIAVPASIWASIADAVTHFPSGWVLMGSAEDRLPGSPAAYVTDTYQYIQTYTP